MSLDPVEVEVQRSSWFSVVSVVFCWGVFAVGALFLPLRFAVLGLVDSTSLFGFPLQPDRVSEIHQDWVFAIVSAVGSTCVLLAVVVLWRLRRRNLISGWVTASAAGAVALFTWAAASSAPLSGF